MKSGAAGEGREEERSSHVRERTSASAVQISQSNNRSAPLHLLRERARPKVLDRRIEVPVYSDELRLRATIMGTETVSRIRTRTITRTLTRTITSATGGFKLSPTSGIHRLPCARRAWCAARRRGESRGGAGPLPQCRSRSASYPRPRTKSKKREE